MGKKKENKKDSTQIKFCDSLNNIPKNYLQYISSVYGNNIPQYIENPMPVYGNMPQYIENQISVYGNVPHNNKSKNKNILSKEEIQSLKKQKKKLNFKFSNNNELHTICTHKDNGCDVIISKRDGSGNVYCPICEHEWNPDMKTKEEVQELVNELINQIENDKLAGDHLNRKIIKELSGFVKLLEQYPELHDTCIKKSPF